MKTALLISGHLRSIDKTIENLIELKEKINADIFIHTWSERESTIKSWRKYEKYDEIIESNNKFIKIIKPKSIEVENPIEVRNNILKQFNINSYSKEIEPIFYQLYGINRVFELMNTFCITNNINYSCVIRYRFDLVCSKLNSFKKDIKKIVENKAQIIMMDHNWCSITDTKSDVIIITSKEAYKSINDLIKQNFYDIYLMHSKAGIPIPEAILTNLIRMKYPLIQSCNFNVEVIRCNDKFNQFFKKHKIPFLSRIISLIKLNVYLHDNSKKIIDSRQWQKLYIKNRNFLIEFFSYIISRIIIFKKYKLKGFNALITNICKK